MIRKNLGLYIIGAITAVISTFMIVVMTLSLTGALSVLKHEYRVTFKNYDETVLYIDTVERGNDAEYVGDMPEREPDNDFYYVFIGWDRPLTNVQSSFITHAQFSKVTNQGQGTGTATGENEDGGSQGENQDNGGTSHTGPGEDTVGGGGEGTGVGGDSGGSGGGGGGSGGGGGGTGEGDQLYDKFQIKTMYDGNVYLRTYSYGTQYHPDENKWDAPEEMFEMDTDLTNPMFYTASKAAKVSEFKSYSQTIGIHYTMDDVPMPVPLYPFKFVSSKGMKYVNDRYVDMIDSLEQEYLFSPFLYSQTNEALLSAASFSTNLVSEENRYRQYVRDNYLFFNNDGPYYNNIVTLSYDWGYYAKTRGQIIEDVATKVRTLGLVNPNYVHQDISTDLGDPISNLFIDGIARPETYANVATFLLRNNGIPARTVKGYRKNTNGIDEYVDVLDSDIYYWTETYVDNVGWMHIDPIPTEYTTIGTPESQIGHGSGGGGSGGAGGSDGSVGDSEEGEGATYDVMNVSVKTKDVYYLRERSFVNYNDNQWNFENYSPFTPATLNPIYYASDKMRSKNLSTSKIDITFLTNLDYYPMPQYDAIYVPQYHDDNCLYYQSNEMKYSTVCYPDIDYDDAVSSLSSVPHIDVEDVEVDRYSDFVQETYLTVPSYLSGDLLSFLNEKDLHAGDDDLVNKVSAILRDSGDYTYDKNAKSSGDVVLNFLNVSKKGRCSLFASASVLLYRQLGIPARYVVGWLADASEKLDISLTPKEYHAWCEVYVEDIGWIAVDNTAGVSKQGDGGSGGGGSGGGGGGGGDTPVPKVKLDFAITDTTITYRGTPITAEELNLTPVSYANLNSNHKVVGYQLAKNYIDAGMYNISLNVVVKDKYSNADVSNQYYASVSGQLTINHRELTITTGSASKPYDGTPLTCPDYSYSNLASTDTLTLQTDGTITERGGAINTILASSLSIKDGNNRSVKHNYVIKYNYGILKVY